MRKAIKGLSCKQHLIMHTVGLMVCFLIWLFALWYTGAWLDYRNDVDGGLLALRLAPQTGISVQWSNNGQSVWFWRGEENRRLWPSE